MEVISLWGFTTNKFLNSLRVFFRLPVLTLGLVFNWNPVRFFDIIVKDSSDLAGVLMFAHVVLIKGEKRKGMTFLTLLAFHVSHSYLTLTSGY